VHAARRSGGRAVGGSSAGGSSAAAGVSSVVAARGLTLERGGWREHGDARLERNGGRLARGYGRRERGRLARGYRRRGRGGARFEHNGRRRARGHGRFEHGSGAAVNPGERAAFMATIAPLKDGKGTVLCRDAVRRGCQHKVCKGWHPKRSSREATRVLDAIKAALPSTLFTAL